MARLVRAIHFPEAFHILHRFWKMDGVRTLSLRTKGGHDGLLFERKCRTQLGGPLLRAMTIFGLRGLANE
jgi:hypothetical protein